MVGSASAAAVLSLLVAGCSGQRPVLDAATSTTRSGQVSSGVVVPGPPMPEVPGVPAFGSLATDADPHLLFVDPAKGNDTNDGQTSSRAWASLQMALDRLRPGDTLFLMGGDYRDAIKPGTSHFQLTVSGTEQAWIRVSAAPGQSPTILASAGNGIEISGNYLEVSGLTILGQGFGTDNDYGWGLLTRNNHHVRLADNKISGMPVGGITSVESTNLDIIDNVVHDNSFWGPEQGSGISLWHSRDYGTAAAADGYHDHIIGNTVYRNENKVLSEQRDQPVITDGNGIIVDQADETGYTGRVLVANNLVFDNGGRAILVLESSRVDVVYNTTYQNGRTKGLEGGPTELAAGRANDVRFLDNLAWSRPGAPATIVAGARNIVSGGNVFVTDSPSPAHSASDRVITTDPGIVKASIDPAAADFRPRVGSILLGSGLPVNPYLTADADHKPRPAGAGTVGAYQDPVGS